MVVKLCTYSGDEFLNRQMVALYSGGGDIGDGSAHSLGLFGVQVPHVGGISPGLNNPNYFINLTFLKALILKYHVHKLFDFFCTLFGICKVWNKVLNSRHCFSG